MKLAYHVRHNAVGWTASLRRGDETPLPANDPFVLPNGGSMIRRSSASAPGHVLLSYRADTHRNLEMHGSLKWEGRSGAKHECDVSVVPRNIAHALRTQGGGFPRGLPVAAIECKDKRGVGTLDETRETLARMFDLVLVTKPAAGVPTCRIYEARTHRHWGGYQSTYRGFFATGAFAIVRKGTFQSGAATLANHYSIRHYASIYTTPAAQSDLEKQFTAAVKAAATL